MMLVDLRNHGKSEEIEGLDPPHDMSCANRDYGENVKTSQTEQLWVLDSVPGEVTSENNDGEVEKVLQTLKSLPSTVPSRKWLVNHMIELGFSKSLSEWIGTNLKKSGERETWGFNLEGAVQMFHSYRAPSKRTGDSDYIRAEKSDRWDADVIIGWKGSLARKEMDLPGIFQFMFFPIQATGSIWTIPRAFLKLWHPS
ncbi:hypothetical protein CRYUN_Cryun08bG0124100 [Craigia yunnanensis]